MHFLNCFLKYPIAFVFSWVWLTFAGLELKSDDVSWGWVFFWIVLAVAYNTPAITEMLDVKKSIVDQNVMDSEGNTPLHLAVNYGGDFKLVDPLLARGAQVDARNDAYETPFLIAAKAGNETAVRKLLSLGADIYAFNAKGDTSLYFALLFKHEGVLGALLEHGLDLSKPFTSGDTKPLAFAIEYSNHYIVQALLSAGANANDVDTFGNSMLQLAAKKGNFRMVQSLVDAGADPNFVDRKGKTAMDLATVPPVQAVLRGAQAKVQ